MKIAPIQRDEDVPVILYHLLEPGHHHISSQCGLGDGDLTDPAGGELPDLADGDLPCQVGKYRGEFTLVCL